MGLGPAKHAEAITAQLPGDYLTALAPAAGVIRPTVRREGGEFGPPSDTARCRGL